MKHKKANFVPIFAILLFAGLSCKYFTSSYEKPPSEKTEQKPPATSENSTVWLNAEKMGTIQDLSKLQELTENIYKERMNNGVFKEGTNEVAFHIHLIINSNPSLKNLAKIRNAIAGSQVTIPKSSPNVPEPEIVKPNPLFLAVAVGDSDTRPEIPFELATLLAQDEDKYSVHFSISQIDETLAKEELLRDLHFKRIYYNSLEINAAGEFFINEKHDLSNAKGDVYDYQVKQRRVEKNNLKAEIQKILSSTGFLEIIANENAGYKVLKEVFDATEDLVSSYQITLIPTLDKT